MPASLRTSALLIGLGIVFDAAVNQQAPGASLSLLTAVVAGAMLLALPRSPERTTLCLAAAGFAGFIAFRDDEALIMADVLAAGALLAVAATGSGALRIGVRSVAVRIGGLIRSALQAPAAIARPLLGLTGIAPPGALRPALRAAIVAVPVLAVFTGLLASADAVFASVVRIRLPELRLGSFLGHVVVTAIGATLCGTLWVAAGRPAPADAAPRRPWLGPGEWITVLSGMTFLFSVFVVVQLAYLFGGRHRVQVTTGLTYAEYARSGFFQLLAAVTLTAVVVLVAWDRGRRPSAASAAVLRWLVTALALLCAVMIASAWKRLGLYQEMFGWTLNRFVAGLAIIWIAAVLLALAAALWTGRREHMGAAAAAAALAILVAANILAPSSFVARRNIQRFAATGKLDVPYLVLLGTDAVPALVSVLPQLPPDPDVTGYLCELHERVHRQGWRSWNLARVRAREALRALPCPPTVSGLP